MTRWVKGPYKMHLDSENFYVGQRGKVGGREPTRESSNFIHLAGSTDGDFLLGKSGKFAVSVEK